MNQILNFWNHFQQNNFVFLFLNEIHQDELKIHFDKLTFCLHQYNKDLNIIVKNKKQKGELILTTNGNPYLFKEVELLVHHAPKIERWKITAFLEPDTNLTKFEDGTDNPLIFYGIHLKISEMYFEPFESLKKPTNLGIKVFIKNYIIHKDNPRLQEAIYTIIEHLIGEKSFANDLTFIEIGQLETNQEDLIELYNLQPFIESFLDN